MKTYIVNIGGLDHTLRLSPEDAERLGAKAVETAKPVKPKAATAPANKAAKAPADKSKD